MNIKTMKTCLIQEVCDYFNINKRELTEFLDTQFTWGDTDYSLVSLTRVLEVAEDCLGLPNLVAQIPPEWQDVQVVLET